MCVLTLCTQEGSLHNGASHLHKSPHKVHIHHPPFSFMKVEDFETIPEHFASSGFLFFLSPSWPSPVVDSYPFAG